MTAQHDWQVIEPILDAVLELPESERPEFLERACESHPTLHQELIEFLRAGEAEGGILDQSATGFAALLIERQQADQDPSLIGHTIGPYRITRELARGGMGQVFLAERADGQFDQHVALKLIRRGMDSDEIERRFLAERQILARLNHPNIARLLDGGVTSGGQPWFAMEYVEGTPITRHCHDQRLTRPERLVLFQAVCEAIRYAHQNLIVHRDIKPSNVLVTASGTVKLLDFGIAKLLESSSEETTRTATMIGAMTPEYAAPEQVRMEPVSTATDVYALGAVLYELLTGRRAQFIPRLTPTEIERVVCEVEPAPPGLSPDLDTIILKALQKDPARRYASAEAFLEDLDRYQSGLPVRARPDTAGYRARKFIRRHRLGVTAAAAVFLSLVLGVAIAWWQAGVARREATRAGEVKEFLIGLFQGAHPERAAGREVTAVELLDLGTRRLDSALADDPEIQIDLFTIVSRLYVNLGRYAQADSLFGRTVELAREFHGENHPIMADLLTRWATPLVLSSRYEKADSVLGASVAIQDRLGDRNQADLSETLAQLGNLKRLRADLPAGEELFRRALAISRETIEINPLRVAAQLRLFGLLLWEAGKFPAADTVYQEALGLMRQSLDPNDPEITRLLRNLSLLRQSQGDLVSAERLGREVLEKRRRLFPKGHPDVSNALHELAGFLESGGKLAEAESTAVEALAMRRELMGAERVETFDSEFRLSSIRRRMGDLAGAETGARNVLAGWGRLLQPDHTFVLLARHHLGLVLLSRGKLTEAEALMSEALAGRRKRLGNRHVAVGISLTDLGSVAHRLGRPAGAEENLREALDIYRTVLPPRHLNTANALTVLGEVLTDGGRAGEAEPLLRESLDIRQEKLHRDDTRLAETRRVLGLCLLKLGRPGEAEPMLLESYRSLTGNPWGERQLGATARTLVRFYHEQKQPDRAAEFEGAATKQ